MRSTLVRYVVLLWLCLFALLAYLHRGAVAVPARRIQADLEIGDGDMAWVMSAFFWGYAILQVPGGWLADRWGSRRAVCCFMLLASLTMVFMGLAEGFIALLASRLLMGFAQAGLFPASVNSFTKWFPAAERGLPNGLLGSSMMLGAMLGSAVIGWLLKDADLTWRQIFLLFGAPGLVSAVWFFTWFRDYPEDHPRVNNAELNWIQSVPALAKNVSKDDGVEPPRLVDAIQVQETGLKAGVPIRGERSASADAPIDVSKRIRTGAGLLVMIFICGQQFFRGAGNLFYMSWFPTFLQETRSVSLEAAGLLTSMPLAGMVVGSAFGGRAMDWIYQKTGSQRLSRHGLAMASMTIATLFFVVPYWMPQPLPAVLFLTVSSFAAGMGGPAAYTVTIDMGGKSVATVFSVMNMAGNIGAALAPHLVIWWKDWLGWDAVLFLQASFFTAALLCWLGMSQFVGKTGIPQK